MEGTACLGGIVKGKGRQLLHFTRTNMLQKMCKREIFKKLWYKNEVSNKVVAKGKIV